MTGVATEEFKMTELGPLPPEWEVVRLGDVAKVTSGGSAPQGKEFFNGQNPFVRVQHLELEIDMIRRWDLITDEAVNNLGLRLYPKGTIVFPKSGASIYLEKRAILPIDAYIVSHLCAVISRSQLISQDFLFYYLRFSRLSEQKAEGYPTLNLSEIKQRRIARPPLPEQEIIAYVLSSVQTAIEKTEVVTKATRELRKSLVKHLFTYGPVSIDEAENVPLRETEIGLVPREWEVIPLQHMVEISSGQIDPRSNLYRKMVNVGPENIESAIGRLVHLKTAEELSLISGKYLFTNKHVLYSKIRPYLRKAALPAFDGMCSADIYPLRPKNESLLREFLFYLLLTNQFTERAQSFQTRTRIPKINRNQLGSIPIQLPSLPEQRQIIKVLSTLNSKLESEDDGKKALEELFRTLLSNLMTGKIRVNNLEVPV